MNTKVRDVVFRQDRLLTSADPHPFVIVHICVRGVHYMCVCTSNTEWSVSRTLKRSVIVEASPAGPFKKRTAIECHRIYESPRDLLGARKRTGEVNLKVFEEIFGFLIKNADLKTSIRKALALSYPKLVPKELIHLTVL